ncbi:MAG: YraN family protein [Oscillospiraceae bacterium]|nr:YraN family protein [Oscillospiraceae bacterium]
MDNKTNKQNLGSFGEDAAAAFLSKKGFTILQRNFSFRLGEIDLIASEGEYLAFVEVKLRKNADYGEAKEFVTLSKQKRIILAAKMWLSRHPTELQPRFDVAEVYAPQGTKTCDPIFRYWEDAFSAD